MKIKSLIVFTILFLIQNITQASDTLRCFNGYEFEPEIFERAEYMPSFPGGRTALFYFIQDNIVLFEKNKDSTTSEFIVKFYIDTTGTICQPRVLKTNLSVSALDFWCDVLKRMPKWNIAKQRGRPVKCDFGLSIYYSFNEWYTISLKEGIHIKP